MAIRSVLFQSHGITAESLDGVPWEIASHVWRRLVDSYATAFKQRTADTNDGRCRQLDSLQVWKAFASAYPLELDKSLKRRHQIIGRPNMRLGDYMKPLCSHRFDWITFLTLSNILCSRTDLVQVSQLPNVGVLTIGPNVLAEDIGLDDSIVRSWARTAETSDAFSMLRVFSCRSQQQITQAVFSHLNRLPALALFNVEDCGLGPQHRVDALHYGWQYKTGNHLSDLLVKGGTTRASWDSVMHACFQLGGSVSKGAITAEGVEAIDGLPRLHLSLGGNPHDAAIDAVGVGSMRSFYRLYISAPHNDEMLTSPVSKRPRSQIPTSGTKRPCTERRLRASQKQDMEALLMDFGG